MEFDYVLVGGGLQSALIALAVLARRPGARVAIVERDASLGGNHLWSFHAGDAPDDARPWIEPLVVARWSGYDVAFPGLRRSFEASPYASVSAERLRTVVAGALAASPGSMVVTGAVATAVGAREVTLQGGRSLRGRLVVDARGQGPAPRRAAWQKFVGLELALRADGALARPLLMDATVPQVDGFRFVYVLPLRPRRVLVEDTYFSEDPRLDEAAVRARALAYAGRLGLVTERVLREERGVLPLPLDTPFASPPLASPLVAGARGGWYHPTTGYTFPVAARLALHLSTVPVDAVFGDAFRALCAGHARQARFAALLNRLLFRATEPAHRRAVFERFHRLPEHTVRRFYALATTPADRARILCGRPPRGVSLGAALTELVAS